MGNPERTSYGKSIQTVAWFLIELLQTACDYLLWLRLNLTDSLRSNRNLDAPVSRKRTVGALALNTCDRPFLPVGSHQGNVRSVTGADCCDGNPLRRIGDEQKLTAYPATVCCSVAKLPLETRCNCFRYGFFTGRRLRNLADRQLSGFLSGRTRHESVIRRQRNPGVRSPYSEAAASGNADPKLPVRPRRTSSAMDAK